MIEAPRILVVDDVATNRLVMRKLLSKLDRAVEVVEAANGADALAIALEQPLALVLLDVQMPGMDGYEVAGYLHGEESTSHIPIIFVTAAYREDSDRLHGYGCGAVDYIEKPLDERILLSKVRVFVDLYCEHRRVEELAQDLRRTNARLEEEIQRRASMEEQLRILAITDALTGLYNRRAFFDLGEREIGRCRRYDLGAFTCVMLDIDFFKRVNDTHGHAVGDEVIIALARMMKSRFRSSDICARIGGEEFAVICPGSDLVRDAQPLEDFRREVETFRLPASSTGDPVRFTVSIGVTLLDAGDTSLNDVLERADRLLYEAKHAGRNRVVAALAGVAA